MKVVETLVPDGASHLAEISRLIERMEAAEEEQSTRTRMIQAFMDQLPACLLVCSRNHIVMISDTCEDLFGMKDFHMIGLPISRFVHPHDIKRFSIAMETLEHGNVTGEVFRMAAHPAKWIECEFSATKFDALGLSFMTLTSIETQHDG